MIQKLIAHLHDRKVTKTYNENNPTFICNFILTYKDEQENYHNMSCYSVDLEPIVLPKQNLYYVEVDVYSRHNVRFDNNRIYSNNARVLKITPLTTLEEIKVAKDEIEKHYKKDIG